MSGRCEDAGPHRRLKRTQLKQRAAYSRVLNTQPPL